MSRIRWGVAVVIPAHDEEDRLVVNLLSIAESVDRAVNAGLTDPEASWVIVVADACRDNTAKVASEVLRACRPMHGRVVVSSERNVGSARRIGCDIGLGLLAGRPADRIWLAHTDADTTVPPEWLIQHLREADRGIAAVAGVVRVASVSDHPSHVANRFSASYMLYPDGSHPHVHGANLGTRADAYCDAGGWFDAPLAEDHCLWNRIRACFPVNATARSWVTTSGRLVGRAAGGFADTLRALAETPAHISVCGKRSVGGQASGVENSPA